jgi:hypothetical protein
MLDEVISQLGIDMFITDFLMHSDESFKLSRHLVINFSKGGW